MPKPEPPDQFSSMFASAPARTQHFMDFVVDAFPSQETRNTGFAQGFLHMQEFLSWSTPDFPDKSVDKSSSPAYVHLLHRALTEYQPFSVHFLAPPGKARH